MASSYAKTITIDDPYEEAVTRVKEAFRAQGFGTPELTPVAEEAGRRIDAALASLQGAGPPAA